MKKIILKDWPIYTFQVVDHVPNNYFIWNIHQIEKTGCYIPFCKKDLNSPYAENGIYTIDPDSLLAVKVTKREADYLRYAAGIGVNSKSAAHKLVESNPRERWKKEQKRYAKKVLDIFRRLYI